MSTEKADSLTKPGIKRSVHDSETEKAGMTMPRLDRNSEAAVLSTERADNLNRPGDQLPTDEVEERVDDAALVPDLQGSQQDD